MRIDQKIQALYLEREEVLRECEEIREEYLPQIHYVEAGLDELWRLKGLQKRLRPRGGKIPLAEEVSHLKEELADLEAQLDSMKAAYRESLNK